jgi:hypothetical protein
MIHTAILESITEAAKDHIANELIFENRAMTGSNEYLFFIKPELTLPVPSIRLDLVMEMILGKIEESGLRIRNARVQSAAFLRKHGLIARHYGVINQIASNARNAVVPSGKERFSQLFGVDFDTSNVMGGIEFLNQFPFFSPTALDYLWQSGKFEKLSGGTYVLPLTLDGNRIYLVNGFHPRQLEHFENPGRSIVLFTLVGDTPWKKARNALIGTTNPATAVPGSIRRCLLDNREAFGLAAVTSSWNGVHLSAGPVEALNELIRYQSDPENGQLLTAGDFQFGRDLIARFGLESTLRFLANPTVSFKGKPTSVFDLTEETDSSEALDILSTID